MNDYILGKDIQEIKERLARLEKHLRCDCGDGDVRSSANASAGCDASGGASGSISVQGTTVTVRFGFNVKLKCPIVGNVVDYSDSLSYSKDLSELTPCVDVNETKGYARIKGRLCLRDSRVCFEKGELFVTYKGDDYKISDIPTFCFGV